MKPIMLLLTSSLVIAAGHAASAQDDACQNQYGSCADHCVTRPQSTQESCMKSCEVQSDQCYVKVFGPRGPAINVDSASSAQDSVAMPAKGQATR